MGKDFIYDSQLVFSGNREIIGFGGDEFKVVEIPRRIANELISKNHYSKKFYSASYVHLGIFIASEMVGVLQYGYAMNPASMGSVVKNTQIDEYMELNRMWLSDDAPKNSESRAISYSIKYIKRKFPKIKWIQSFADERCKCFGVVYQACSFNYYGEHTSVFWTVDNVVYHDSLMTRSPTLSKSAKFIQDNKDRATCEKLRQFRYIKFLDKRCKKNCLLEEMPYPKWGDSHD